LQEGGELMATEFFIPKLGQTVEEVKIVGWLVPDGTKVDFGQGILDVETDKAVFPVEANAKGILHIGPYKDGDVLPVLTVVAIIGKPEDKFTLSNQDAAVVEQTGASGPAPTDAGQSALKTAASADESGKIFVSPRARKLAEAKSVDLEQVPATGYGGVRVVERDVVAFLDQQPKVSPIAQKMATEAGLDLRNLAGTGPRGRIVKEDVTRALVEQQPVSASATPAPQSVAKTEPTASLPEAEVTERIPLKGVRAIIANRMGASVHTTARVTLMMEVDATEFVAARTRLKERVSEEWKFAPGFNDLLAKIVAAALRKFPYMNARLATDAIEILSHVNIGMAVDTDRGLLVTVVRDADRKNLFQFGSEFRQMVERARVGRSSPDDLTNLGMYDVDAFTPVINLPEAAILGVGRIAPKPVARGSAIEIRQMWTLSLVFDHRLVDGAPAAKFLQYIKQLIEEPYLLLTM
jgi:pyruvate dehydrogenase E2 component (dihydrolipoamide acetyltransferase)